MKILYVIYVYYQMLMMEMKWFFVNDVMHVYIKIVMEYQLYQMEHGFVNHVQF